MDEAPSLVQGESPWPGVVTTMACDSCVSSAKLRLESLRAGRSMEAIELSLRFDVACGPLNVAAELSVGWVDPRAGLGWVGNGSKICVFSGLGWVMGVKWQMCEIRA